MRFGFTTGTCAAAAAKASTIFITKNKIVNEVCVKNLEGQEFFLKVAHEDENFFSVIKDSGDDVNDVTNGVKIFASVEILEDCGKIFFERGEGVGIVTLPGLKIPVGEVAVNPVPRKMIELAVREIIQERSVKITIKIPGGEEIAKRTFNPRLGIVGGLSILGTSGIVKSTNEKALLDSLTLELNMIKALGFQEIYLTFAGTGEKILRKIFNLNSRNVVQTGNYIGYVIDEALKLNFNKIKICGHPGKLLKVAAGSFNTHSKIADGRLEALCTHLALAGVNYEFISKIFNSNTTNEAINLIEAAKFNFVWDNVAAVIAKKCRERTLYKIKFDVFIIDNEGKILGSFKDE
ncbi:MAG: cobalamin biosynthesis protein CbiD [Synergistaceae bacterium]|nr:cobalamin biosynthesis protein CbiD [Synergistaceae bacterium]